jgi:hypothetical protein
MFDCVLLYTLRTQWNIAFFILAKVSYFTGTMLNTIEIIIFTDLNNVHNRFLKFITANLFNVGRFF